MAPLAPLFPPPMAAYIRGCMYTLFIMCDWLYIYHFTEQQTLEDKTADKEVDSTARKWFSIF